MNKPVMQDFIYQKFIDKKICEDIIQYFKDHPHMVTEGECGGGVIKEIKDCSVKILKDC